MHITVVYNIELSNELKKWKAHVLHNKEHVIEYCYILIFSFFWLIV